jgi:hypothetical protein
MTMQRSYRVASVTSGLLGQIVFTPARNQRKEPSSALCALGHLRLVPSASEDEKDFARVLERVKLQ